MLHVKSVQPHSIAEELGLEPGSRLISVNGRELEDFLDWEFLTADDRFVLEAQTPEGILLEFDIARPEGLTLGVELEPPRVIRCNNRCDFCFVKGNPKGLRSSLYMKDDDYRLSFRYGNYVTLTNLIQRDVDRILEYRLTPLYVSVHASDNEVRRRVLGNPNAPDVIGQMEELVQNEIALHTQIVLQPGINDGSELVQTLEDLYELGDNLLSVSVVPVGLTTYNQSPAARAPTRQECRRALESIEVAAARAFGERGKHWAYGSDELYLNATVELPAAERYDDFEQLENGVGVVRYFQQGMVEFAKDLSHLRIGIATGTAMGRLFPDILTTLSGATGAEFDLLVLENDLFGPSVTTAALLPGRAFVSAYEGRDDLDLAIIPAEAVNDSEMFLDDMTLDEVSAKTGSKILLSRNLIDVLAVL